MSDAVNATAANGIHKVFKASLLGLNGVEYTHTNLSCVGLDPLRVFGHLLVDEAANKRCVWSIPLRCAMRVMIFILHYEYAYIPSMCLWPLQYMVFPEYIITTTIIGIIHTKIPSAHSNSALHHPASFRNES